MKYCADTWFLLKLSEKEPKAIDHLREVRTGKDELIVPMIVVSETYRKLFERGTSEKVIETIFSELEAVNKVEFLTMDKQIAIESAKVSFSNSVPLIDSVIAATYKLTKCDFVLTDDDDLKKLHKKKYLKIKNW